MLVVGWSSGQEPEKEPIGMVFVEGGTFQMGSNSGDSDEKPVHTVTVSSFYMDKTEVTQAEYRKVMGKNPSWFSGCDDCPVEQVSLYDANEYAKKVGKRLPTEAEWEYAARGGNKSKGYRYSGGNNLDAVGWYDNNSDDKTHPVAQKQPNELGLYDMSGNVGEWCSDWYSDSYYSYSPKNDPQGPKGYRSRVLRGGGWSSSDVSCRVANRGRNFPESSNYRYHYDRGFRLVLFVGFSGEPFDGSTLIDIDGNSYNTVKIGDQVWMAENLKVTHFRNSDPIPTGHTYLEWNSLSTGAYAVYDNNEANADTYGYLYNWYAVNDSRNIAPEGWHVPTDEEWQTLVDYLGGEDVAGRKLKEAGTEHWNSKNRSNKGATNESGFTALPGGSRQFGYSGIYYNMYDFGYFWSSTEYGSDYAWLLGYDRSSVIREDYDCADYWPCGFSIRCIRD
jgi:uncharacterized protein (TIGR02145 family)